MIKGESPVCFGCGPENPCGLRLQFEVINERIFTKYVAGREHEGYDGILHGGITAALLDELMGELIQRSGLYSVTGELTTRYLLPVPTGEELNCSAEIQRQEGRKIYVHSSARLPDGTIAATGDAIFVEIKKKGVEGGSIDEA